MSNNVQRLGTMLRNMAEAIAVGGLHDRHLKFLVIQPGNIEDVDPTAYESEQEAAGRANGRTVVGATVMVHDVARNRGWDDHPAGGITVISDNGCVVMRSNDPMNPQVFDISQFDSYLVIVPKGQS